VVNDLEYGHKQAEGLASHLWLTSLVLASSGHNEETFFPSQPLGISMKEKNDKATRPPFFVSWRTVNSVLTF